MQLGVSTIEVFKRIFRDQKLLEIKKGRPIECVSCHAGRTLSELCKDWEMPVDPQDIRVNGEVMGADYCVQDGDRLFFPFPF